MDTPQMALSGSKDYASGAQDVHGSSTGSSDGNDAGDSTANSTANGDNQTTGYSGPASELLMRYRESIINVDLMIIERIGELYMQVWDNGDTFTNGYQY
jgi:hypothetical protein